MKVITYLMKCWHRAWFHWHHVKMYYYGGRRHEWLMLWHKKKFDKWSKKMNDLNGHPRDSDKRYIVYFH